MPPSNNPAWIDWRNSEPSKIILFDLRTGRLGLSEEEHSTAVAWEYYQRQPEFQRVCFDQFAARLVDHRQQVEKRVRRARWDAAAAAHDQLRHPYPSHNQRGEPNFHLSGAEDLLRQDVRNGLHLALFPSELQMTRPEYRVFSKKKFKDCVYQTVRHVKFKNFLQTRGHMELPFDYHPPGPSPGR